MRLIAVKSSADQERYENKLQKQQGELEKDISALSKKTFACKEDAQKEWDRFEKRPQIYSDFLIIMQHEHKKLNEN